MSPLPTEPQQFADLEKQAAVAEKRLTELQKQVSQLQHNTEQKHTQFKTDLLAQLHHLRQTMVGERTEAERAIAMNDIMKKENDELKKQNEKLKYRINILLRSLEEEEAKNK